MELEREETHNICRIVQHINKTQYKTEFTKSLLYMVINEKMSYED
jgi:hypothetical protein